MSYLTLVLAAFLICTSILNAANITAVQSGLWGTSSTWMGGTFPGNGDTVNIPDGIIVTLNESRTIGTSSTTTVRLRRGPRGPDNTIAISLNNSGRLIISQDGVLIARGDIVYTAADCANTSNALIMQAGSTLEFDSSVSISPAATHYAFGPSGNSGCRGFFSAGTALLRNSIRSNPGGGAGQIAMRGNTGAGGSFTATYTDFLGIGDASTPGWQIAYEYSGNHYVKWDVTYSTFRNCGTIASTNFTGIDDAGTFRHSYNVHSQSAASEIFSHWITITAPGAGTREIRNDVFDVALSRSQFYLGGFSVWSNYFGDAIVTGGTTAWNSFQGNLVRFVTTSYMGVTGDIQDSYIYLDSDRGNPHLLIMSSPVPSNLRGLIYGQGGTATGGISDSGELWWLSDAAMPGTQSGIYNSIVLANMAGHSSLELGSLLPANINLVGIAEHNTWFGGYTTSTVQGAPGGFPAVQLGEGRNGPPGTLGSFRSNILWNPEHTTDTNDAPYNYQASFFKLADISYSATPTLDYCSPVDCDYNSGWNYTAADSQHPQYKNQGKGYAASFSSPPGVHDVDVDPQFLDPYRTLELFDSKYLGNHPAEWDSSATYSIGQFVSWAQSPVYWAFPVNYRYINSGSCSGANPQPGSGTNWRACWEWASLYDIRQAVAAQTRYDDQIIGAHGVDVITALMQWIRAGYSPTNTALAGSAHDGTDIGAVPVTFAAPTVGASALP